MLFISKAFFSPGKFIHSLSSKLFICFFQDLSLLISFSFIFCMHRGLCKCFSSFFRYYQIVCIYLENRCLTQSSMFPIHCVFRAPLIAFWWHWSYVFHYVLWDRCDVLPKTHRNLMFTNPRWNKLGPKFDWTFTFAHPPKCVFVKFHR